MAYPIAFMRSYSRRQRFLGVLLVVILLTKSVRASVQRVYMNKPDVDSVSAVFFLCLTRSCSVVLVALRL